MYVHGRDEHTQQREGEGERGERGRRGSKTHRMQLNTDRLSYWTEKKPRDPRCFLCLRLIGGYGVVVSWFVSHVRSISLATLAVVRPHVAGSHHHYHQTFEEIQPPPPHSPRAANSLSSRIPHVVGFQHQLIRPT